MGFNFNPTLWFICRFCRRSFASTESLKEHKLECHLGECQGIKCIVFEERLLDTEWNPEPNINKNSTEALNVNQENRTSGEEFRNKDYDSATESSFKNPYIPLARITEQEEINSSFSESSSSSKHHLQSSTTSKSAKHKQPEIQLRKQKLGQTDQNHDESGFGSNKIHEDVNSSEASCSSEAVSLLENVEVKIEVSDEDFNSNEESDSETNLANVEMTMDTFGSDLEDMFSAVQTQSQEPQAEAGGSNQFQKSSLPNRHSESETSNPIEKPFMCETCFLFFRTKHKLFNHMLCHSSIKPFKCSQCPSKFKRKNELVRHQIVHGVETNYKCRFCHRCFGAQRSLDNHERTHTGDRPFKCPVANCDYAGSSNSGLDTHTRARHGEELGLQQFVCLTCGKAYGNRSSLNVHSLQHSSDKPFHCTHEGCDWKFKLKHHLKKHLRRHT